MNYRKLISVITSAIFVLNAILFAPVPPVMAEQDPPSSGECHANIEATVDSLVSSAMNERTIPGMTVAVTKDGEVICNKGYGYKNWENQTPMWATHRAQIGSTTKVLAALAMMKLIEDRNDLHLEKRVYGNDGLLNGQDYRDAYVQGIRRHYPLVGLAIGANNRVIAWYINGTYTVGNSRDLDLHAAPRNFTLPSGQETADLIAIARGGADNRVYSWYRDGRYSIGTVSDLGAYDDPEEKRTYTISSAKNTIVGIAVDTNEDKFYAYYHDGKVSSGNSPADLTNRWEGKDKDYTVSGNQQRRYDIVDVARSDNDNTIVWYSDGKASKGNATDLDAYVDLYDFSRTGIPGSISHWIGEYEKIEIQHLMSHTSGLTKSGDASQGAIKYGHANFNWDTNIIPYKDSNRYVLSTRPLLFDVGTAYSYSNHGMGLVGHLIAEITGQDWYDYMRDNILVPANALFIAPRGMNNYTHFDSRPHTVSSDGQITTHSLPNRNHSGSTSGSLKATAGDLALVMLATDGLANHPDVLGPETLEDMETRPFPREAKGRAHGWAVDCLTAPCLNHRKLWHNGAATDEGTSYIAKYQNYLHNNTSVDKINVAIVTNRQNSRPEGESSLAGRLGVLSDDIAAETARLLKPIYVSSSTSGQVEGVSFRDEDILIFDRVNQEWAIHFDGSDVSLGDRDVNAFHIMDNGTILLSIDEAKTVQGTQYDDSDIIQFTPTSLGSRTRGQFSMYLDGSDVGLTTNAEDIDAVTLLPDGDLVISTLGTAIVSGLTSRDEDLMRFDVGQLGSATSGSWSRYLDGSDIGLTSTTEDIWAIWTYGYGTIHISTSGNYSVESSGTGHNGDSDNIFYCTPGSVGNNTQCTIGRFWNGDDYGFGSESVDGYSLGPEPIDPSQNAVSSAGIDDEPENEEPEIEEEYYDDVLDDDEYTEQVYLPLVHR